MLKRYRIEIEKLTIRRMVGIFCRGRRHELGHAGSGASPVVLCQDCQALESYALGRLDRCPFGGSKPTCARCEIHCYGKDMRARVVEVMRYAGPRMAWRHPWLSLLHGLFGLETRLLGPPERPAKARNGKSR